MEQKQKCSIDFQKGRQQRKNDFEKVFVSMVEKRRFDGPESREENFVQTETHVQRKRKTSFAKSFANLAKPNKKR